jgi:hypothetical protein
MARLRQQKEIAFAHAAPVGIASPVPPPCPQDHCAPRLCLITSNRPPVLRQLTILPQNPDRFLARAPLG